MSSESAPTSNPNVRTPPAGGDAPPRYIVQSGISVGIAFLLVGLSYLLGLLKIHDFLAAFGTFALIAAGVGGALYLATSQSLNHHQYRVEAFADRLLKETRDKLFAMAGHGIANSHAEGRTSGVAVSVIDAPQVAWLEGLSRDVWIYVFDLQWDEHNRAFHELVLRAVEERRTYRFLLPNKPEVQLRAAKMIAGVKQRRELKGFFQFRVRQGEDLFSQFVIQIYNPASTISATSGRDEGPVVAMLPRFSGSPTDPLLKIVGPIAEKYAEDFELLWMRSQLLSIDDLLSLLQ